MRPKRRERKYRCTCWFCRAPRDKFGGRSKREFTALKEKPEDC